MNRHVPSKDNFKPAGTYRVSGQSRFARVDVILVAPLLTLCEGATKNITRVVANSTDSVVVSKVIRKVEDPVLESGQQLEIRLTQNPKGNVTAGLNSGTLARAVAQASTIKICRKKRKDEKDSKECDRSAPPTSLRDLKGSTEEAGY